MTKLLKIENLYAHIRLQELQDLAQKQIDSTYEQEVKLFHEGRFEAFTDAEYILRYASCYTRNGLGNLVGFDKEKAEKLRKTTFWDGNQRYNKNENDDRVHDDWIGKVGL